MIAQESVAATAAGRQTFLNDLAAPGDHNGAEFTATVRPKPRPVHKLRNFHSRADIDAVLIRECSRCERSGQEFCLVVISPAKNGALRPLHQLARLLCRRARASDEIGWFEPRRMCVVLPDTSGDGAMAFVRDFTESANYRGLSPVCNVMSYQSRTHSDNEQMSVEQFAKGIDESARATAAGGETSNLPRGGSGDVLLRLHNSGDVAGLLVRPLPLWKRCIDITFGSLALLLALPLMIGAAVVIKIADPGPVFFKQKRAGLGGRPFTIYKFRTMVVDAESKKSQLRQRSEQDGPAFKIKHDPRITRVGRFLRESSLDELPQLVNVLKGEMSLVGPRPLPVEESNACATWHRRRLDVTPGLTCIWQIWGRSNVSFADWIRMDRRYIRAMSIWQDIKLILLTVPSVFARRGR
jgi:lipopolysaccharide/colanic/teichoic acid biosynthesis glycosyltransferase